MSASIREKLQKMKLILKELEDVVSEGITNELDGGLTIHDMLGITLVAITKRDYYLDSMIKQEMVKGSTKQQAIENVREQLKEIKEPIQEAPKDNVHNIWEAKANKDKKETIH